MTVCFDRGGWSPALFADITAAGFDVLTWRKGPAPDLPAGLSVPKTYATWADALRDAVGAVA